MKNKDNHLVTPLEVVSMDTCYNLWGHITGRNVTVKYHMGKAFPASLFNDVNYGMNAATDWVEDMKHGGCKLSQPVVYERSPSSNIVSVYMICERTRHFSQFPFLNSKRRALRFVDKMQAECNKLDTGLRKIIYSKYENTK